MRETILLVAESECPDEHAGVIIHNFPIIPIGSDVTVCDGETVLLDYVVITNWYVHSMYGIIAEAECFGHSPESRQRAFRDFHELCTDNHSYCGSLYPIEIILK